MSANYTPQMAYPVMYPELYYRVQPVVGRVCREMDNMYMAPFPDQESIERMSDQAYDEIIAGNSDLDEYVSEGENPVKDSTDKVQAEQTFFRPGFGFFPRQRLLRDLVGILLINELFRRRRIFF